jgi:hypothetical protein
MSTAGSLVEIEPSQDGYSGRTHGKVKLKYGPNDCSQGGWVGQALKERDISDGHPEEGEYGVEGREPEHLESFSLQVALSQRLRNDSNLYRVALPRLLNAEGKPLYRV